MQLARLHDSSQLRCLSVIEETAKNQSGQSKESELSWLSCVCRAIIPFSDTEEEGSKISHHPSHKRHLNDSYYISHIIHYISLYWHFI